MLRPQSSSPSFYNPSMASETILPLTTREMISTSMSVVEDNKIPAATANLKPYLIKLLDKQSKQNAITISRYIIAMNAEINPSSSHRENQLKTLCYLSDFHKQRPFLEMTRDDVLQYLDSHRRTEESDPLHKWIGTYNLRRTYLLRFFK
jgi:hypothetical protein